MRKLPGEPDYPFLKGPTKGVEGIDTCACMGSTRSCAYRYVKIDGRVYRRGTSYYDYNEECHDCGVQNKKGNTHHIGCDIESCPKCKKQLFSCGHGEDASYLRKRR